MIERLLAPTPPPIVSESSEPVIDYDIIGNSTTTTSTLIIGENDCVSCGLPIQEKNYLCVYKHGTFHEQCLTCHICHRQLNPIDGGYYVRNGFDQQSHFLCRNDYQAAHQNKCSTVYLPQCAKCHVPVTANELVMRADDSYIYHLDCFTCCLCNVLLKPGDDYGLHGSLLFCRLHLEQTTNTTFPISTTTTTTTIPRNNSLARKKSRSSNSTTSQRKQRTKLNNLENNTNSIELAGFLSSADLTDGTYSSSIFNNQQQQQHQQQQQRTKRNRTSFKHHQLRIMKSFFAQNHNPDSKGLKILSQKTQLTKRVLQVWFQNARAKLRRGLIQEQENKQQQQKPSDNNNGPDHHSHVVNNSNMTFDRRENELLQMLTDDDMGSGTSNDRSRTEDDDLLDEFDDFETNQDSSSTTNTVTPDFNQLMPPYSMYSLL